MNDCRTQADRSEPFALAFTALSEVSRILSEALKKDQRFSVTIQAGDAIDPPKFVPGYGLCETGHLDGSCEILIRVEPPKVCPKCGKNHGIPRAV